MSQMQNTRIKASDVAHKTNSEANPVTETTTKSVAMDSAIYKEPNQIPDKKLQPIPLILTGICLVAFMFIAVSVTTKASWVLPFNEAVATLIQSLRNDNLDPIVISFTQLGNFKALTVINIAIFALYALRRNWRELIIMFLVVIVSLLITQFIKNGVANLRPEGWLVDPGDFYSFPSGHSCNFVVTCGILACFVFGLVKDKNLPKTIDVAVGILCVVCPLLLGISRLYVSVHWCTDVLAGWLLGLIFIIPTLAYFLRKHPHVSSVAKSH